MKTAMRMLTAVNVSDAGRAVARVELADTHGTRARGLLGRASLAAGEGLWITPCSGVHTFFMRFAIDVIGLDDGLCVVRIWPRLAPRRLTRLSWKVRSVVELGDGEAARCGVRVGDCLKFVVQAAGEG